MKRTLILVVLFAAGCAAALSLGVTRASAWDWQSLPSGYGVSNFTTVCHVSTDPCVGGEGSTCNHLTVSGAERTFAETDCVNPTFQADLDAFVNSTICTVNPTAGGQACAPTTTAPPSTTQATTTTDAGTTTTTPAATTGTTTSTTTQEPPPPPPVETVVGTTTVIVTTALTPVEQSLSDQIASLAAQIAALTTRVDRLEHAGDAASLAFEQALENGKDVVTAAQIARGTWLNVVYGLGDFS